MDFLGGLKKLPLCQSLRFQTQLIGTKLFHSSFEMESVSVRGIVVLLILRSAVLFESPGMVRGSQTRVRWDVQTQANDRTFFGGGPGYASETLECGRFIAGSAF
jgi:hypothetical protein